MKKILITCYCLFMVACGFSQEYSFVPDNLKLLTMEELMEKPFPQKVDQVFFEDGTKTTLEKVKPLIMKGAVYPQMYVDKNGTYKILVILGGHYSFVPEELTVLSMDELMAKGPPTKLDEVYYADGTKTTLDDAMKLIQEGKVLPQMFVDGKGEYKVLVLETYDDSGDPYDDIKNPTGEPAKQFSAKTIEGKEISIDALKGKVVVLNFWFIKCNPCVSEMPELNELVEKYKNNKKVVFLGITFDKKASVKKFLKQRAFDYQIISDEKEICDLYDVSAFPTHLIIGKDSKIADFKVGGGKDIINELDKSIQAQLK